jgi:predicted ATPase
MATRNKKVVKKKAVTGKVKKPGMSFISKVRLRGWRTIRDVKITFEPGLNIIIGKNGTGKTSFLQFLSNICSGENGFTTEFQAEIGLIDKNGIPVNVKVQQQYKRSAGGGKNGILQANFKAETISNGKSLLATTTNHWRLGGLDQNQILIGHGIPVDYPLLNQKLAFELIISKAGIQYIRPSHISYENSSRTYFLNYFIMSLQKAMMFGIHKIPNSHDEVVKLFKNHIEQAINERWHTNFSGLQGLCKIEGIRMNNGFSLVRYPNSDEISISDLILEFNFQGAWIKFDQLPDGIKRLLYIVLELSTPNQFLFAKDSALDRREGAFNNIFFLEEPELGIHPHLLSDLMEFIKEQAETHQIILTTHSPDVLDILGNDDLHRIIISEIGENGTTLRHLTSAEQKKARIYMQKEAFLSDYWKFSDLE